MSAKTQPFVAGLPYNEYMRAYGKSHRAERTRIQQRARHALKRKAIAAYGGKCICCGASEEEFLCFHHPNGGGNKHRAEVSYAKGGTPFYRWLKRNGWPKDFELVCHNCNAAKANYGRCPHELHR